MNEWLFISGFLVGGWRLEAGGGWRSEAWNNSQQLTPLCYTYSIISIRYRHPLPLEVTRWSGYWKFTTIEVIENFNIG